MTVRDTSLAAYCELRDSGGISRQLGVIVEHVFHHPGGCSLQEISRATGLGINAVSGRVNEAKERGLLFECPKRPCRITGRTITPVAVIAPDGPQDRMFA